MTRCISVLGGGARSSPTRNSHRLGINCDEGAYSDMAIIDRLPQRLTVTRDTQYVFAAAAVGCLEA